MNNKPSAAHRCAAMVLLTLSLSAAAQPASVDRQARVWAAACAACHGTDGRAQGAVQPIAGRDADQLLRTLLEFKNGQRPATVMQQQAKGYSDAELRRIADYFAAQPAR